MARPRKEDAKDIPVLAVATTIGLLAECDASDLTMGDVAKAVGCSAPALYNHFQNKHALLRAVHDEGFNQLFRGKMAVAARTKGDALKRLREGGLAYMRFALENRALYRLMFSPPPLETLNENPFSRDVGMRSIEFLRNSILACQAEGYLNGSDPDKIAFALWSTVHGAASLILQGRSPLPDRDTKALVAETIETVMGFITESKHQPQTGKPIP